jgi:hypothetical protein
MTALDYARKLRYDDVEAALVKHGAQSVNNNARYAMRTANFFQTAGHIL